MSLCVSLNVNSGLRVCTCAQCGHEHTHEASEEVFSANITHNLNRMAGEAGIYHHLWRPEEIGITQARQLVDPLRVALDDMRARPAHYEQFNASNGWGLYVHFVPWLEQYYQACIDYPDAYIEVSR